MVLNVYVGASRSCASFGGLLSAPRNGFGEVTNLGPSVGPRLARAYKAMPSGCGLRFSARNFWCCAPFEFWVLRDR